MLVKRLLVVACASLLLVAVGCSSSKKGQSASTPTSAITTTTAADATGGTVSADSVALCSAFATLAGLSGTNPGNVADGVAALKSAAEKFRQGAPAEVADSANAYADLIDQAADNLAAAGDDSAAQADAAQGLATAMNSSNILPVITWQSTHCAHG